MDNEEFAAAIAELRSDIINSALDEILAEIGINNMIVKKGDKGWYTAQVGDITSHGQHRHEVLLRLIAELARIGLHGE